MKTLRLAIVCLAFAKATYPNLSAQTTVNPGDTLTIGLPNGGVFANSIIDNGTVSCVNTGANVQTLSGTISGNGALRQIGTGTTLLTAPNTYTDATTISTGTLQIGNGAAIGASIANSVSTTVNAGATLAIYLGNGETFPNSVSNNGSVNGVNMGANVQTLQGHIAGTGVLNQNGTGTTILTGSNIYAGATTINAGTLQIGNGGTTGSPGSGNVVDNAVIAFKRNNMMTVPNLISGSGSLWQIGTGTTILTNAANNILGGTNVSAGRLTIGTAVEPSRLDDGTSAVNVGKGGMLTLVNLVGNTLSNNISNDLEDGGSIVVASANNNTLLGTLSNFTAAPSPASVKFYSLSLTQNGPGNTTLLGNNTFTGDTIVNAGTLQIGNGTSGNITNSAVTVNGGTLAGGNGAVTTVGNTGPITLNGGTLAPGDSTVTHITGILTAHGNFNMGAVTSLNMTLKGMALGTGYDQLKVLGTVTLNAGASLSLNGTLGSVPTGTLFFLVDNDGTDPVIGTFAGAPQGAALPATLNGQRFEISYTGDVTNNTFAGTGNDIVLRPINTSFVIFSTTTYPGIGAETTDYDGDGFTNLQEYLLGADPTVKTESPITHVSTDGLNQISFSRPALGSSRFPSEAGIAYIVQASSDLVDWTTDQIALPASTGTNRGPVTVGNFTYSIVMSGSGNTLAESVIVTDNTVAAQRYIRLFVSKP